MLSVNLSCSKTSELPNFVYEPPDLTEFIESDDKQFQIEAYKSSFNDKLFKNNQTDFQFIFVNFTSLNTDKTD